MAGRAHAAAFALGVTFVSAAAGYAHSAGVSDEGVLHTWGKGEAYPGSHVPAGLGHADGQDKLVPTPVHMANGARNHPAKPRTDIHQTRKRNRQV